MRLPLLQPPPPHLLLVWSGLASDFYRRSALANSEGYYDGCAQVHLSVPRSALYSNQFLAHLWPHMAPPKTHGEEEEYTDDSDTSSSDEENDDEEKGNAPPKTDTPIRGGGELYWTPIVRL